MDLSTIRSSLGLLQKDTDMQRMSGLVLGVVIADLMKLLDAHTTYTDQRLEALEKQLVMLQRLVDKHYTGCAHCGTYVDKDTHNSCHIDECFNPVFIGASVTECEHCCNPTCVFHLTQLDTGVWWCVECVEVTQ